MLHTGYDTSSVKSDGIMLRYELVIVGKAQPKVKLIIVFETITYNYILCMFFCSCRVTELAINTVERPGP